MNSVRQCVYDALKNQNISYAIMEHPAAFTIEEMAQLNISCMDKVVKNLFVRDQKKKRFFIVVLPNDKSVDLKAVGAQLGVGRLSFASEESLMSMLGLSKGSVTPFGVLNDAAHLVEVVVDKAVLSFDHIGVHPNENTATVLLAPCDLVSVLENSGHTVICADLESRATGECDEC